MKYYLYDTEKEVLNIDAIICEGEGIIFNKSNTNRYANPILTLSGKYAYISDDITDKYITDRLAQEAQFPTIEI